MVLHTHQLHIKIKKNKRNDSHSWVPDCPVGDLDWFLAPSISLPSLRHLGSEPMTDSLIDRSVCLSLKYIHEYTALQYTGGFYANTMPSDTSGKDWSSH